MELYLLHGRRQVGVIRYDYSVVNLAANRVPKCVKCQVYVRLLFLQLPDLDFVAVASSLPANCQMSFGFTRVVVAERKLYPLAAMILQRRVILALT